MSLSASRVAEKQEVARKTTWTSIALNSGLTAAQLIVGSIAHSQALIADGIHSLADIVSDFIVLIANRQAAVAPDVDHNYGHNRYETVASLFLGGLLIAVGVGMLWRAGTRIVELQDIPSTTDNLRGILLNTPGVREVHELRTRKMGDLAMVDAHILVDPRISVSEGHFIAESARAQMLADPRVLDALIHVDPESDELNPLPGKFPLRSAVADAVRHAFARQNLSVEALNLHYLSSGFDVDVVLPASNAREAASQLKAIDFDALKRRIGAREIRVTQALDAATTKEPPR
ncbi:cation diffusion facilitator family transporter [Caballeronia peredens]|nr:cation diffusion facilitator family transporter [Caballeronia peredens]